MKRIQYNTSINITKINTFKWKYLAAFVVYINILVPMTFKRCKSFRTKFNPTNDPVTSFITA